MVKKSHSPEQIINKLREVEILLNQGARPTTGGAKSTAVCVLSRQNGSRTWRKRMPEGQHAAHHQRHRCLQHHG